MSAFAQRVNGALRRFPIWPGYILGFVPAVWTFWLGLNNRLGPEPIKVLERELGEIGLQLLIVSLLISPLMQLTRINLCRFRRMIGLMAFWYICLHFATWIFLDMGMMWDQIAKDLTKRPYIIVGFAAFLLLVPVAITSNDLSVRRLTTVAWRGVHKLVFPASLLAAAHYIWLVKAWPPEPIIYGAVVLALCLWRPIYRRYKGRQKTKPHMA